MRRILICTGVLGGGTAMTFAAAAVAATLLPGGTVVPANPMVFERDWVKGGPGIVVPVPEPVPPDVQVNGVWQQVDDAGTGSGGG
jgi:hypothetical protein